VINSSSSSEDEPIEKTQEEKDLEHLESIRKQMGSFIDRQMKKNYA